MDARTLEIRPARFTTADIGDAPVRPDPPGQGLPDQLIAGVTADGAFDIRFCHDAMAARRAVAIGVPRRTAEPRKPDTAGAVAWSDILRTSWRVGRTLRRRRSGHDRRSRAETGVHPVKLLGQSPSARDLNRRVAEFRLRVAVLNRLAALGAPVTEAAGQA